MSSCERDFERDCDFESPRLSSERRDLRWFLVTGDLETLLPLRESREFDRRFERDRAAKRMNLSFTHGHDENGKINWYLVILTTWSRNGCWTRAIIAWTTSGLFWATAGRSIMKNWKNYVSMACWEVVSLALSCLYERNQSFFLSIFNKFIRFFCFNQNLVIKKNHWFQSHFWISLQINSVHCTGSMLWLHFLNVFQKHSLNLTINTLFYIKKLFLWISEKNK